MQAHQAKVLTCHLCQNIFLNFGSYVSHVCFGPQPTARAKFRCKTCGKHDLPTFFDFQHHLRKVHNICEICLMVRISSFFIIIKCSPIRPTAKPHISSFGCSWTVQAFLT